MDRKLVAVASLNQTYFLLNALVDRIKMDKKHFRWTKGFKRGLLSAENSNFDHLIRI